LELARGKPRPTHAIGITVLVPPQSVSSTLSLMALIYRYQLKTACEQENWDLLDLLLETEATHLNNKALFTETWGGF
jgi:hypothetical protein